MLEQFYADVFHSLNALPLWWAKAGALALFGGVIALVWALPRDYVYEAGTVPVWHRDLRLWASGLLVIQLALYWVF